MGQLGPGERESQTISNYRRPWWLLVNKPAGLITTEQEESNPGERIFIIRGEPLVQGLAWLTWGPVAALLAGVILAGLAVSFDVRDQSGAMRAFFVAAFLILPALAWGGATVALTRLSARHLQAERQADSQECIIRLNQKRGELFYQTTAHPQSKKLAYNDIRQVRLAYPLGQRGKAPRLTLDTNEGAAVLLDETLATQAQKSDLANEIQQALKIYSG